MLHTEERDLDVEAWEEEGSSLQSNTDLAQTARSRGQEVQSMSRCGEGTVWLQPETQDSR